MIKFHCNDKSIPQGQAHTHEIDFDYGMLICSYRSYVSRIKINSIDLRCKSGIYQDRTYIIVLYKEPVVIFKSLLCVANGLLGEAVDVAPPGHAPLS